MPNSKNIKNNIDRISIEIYQLALKKAKDLIVAHNTNSPRSSITLNSEKQRREHKKEALTNELTKANEQLRIEAELTQADDC